MKNKLKCIVVTFLFIGIKVYSQEEQEKLENLDEVVVVATKFEIEKEKVGKIIYQITAEELQNAKGKTVADVLDNLAGIQIFGNNSVEGKNKNTYMRGGRSHQTLYLIDGVPLNDPSGINNAFDVRFLTLNQIESIEVMNGAASTLYGSGAATGVVNIKLKDNVKKPIAAQYQTSVGTNNSQENQNFNINNVNQNVNLSGELNKFNYLASLNVSLVDGLSESSDENSYESFEKDKFQTTNTYLRFGYNFSEKFKAYLYNNYDRNVYDYDAGAYSDSDINNGQNEQLRFGLSSNYKYTKGTLKLVASYNESNRILNEFNNWTGIIDNFEYKGKSYYVDLVNDYKIMNQFQLITGLTYQYQSNQTNSPYGDIDEGLANFNMIDPYFTVVYNSKFGFNLNAGARLNIHSEYGNHWVYNVNPSYNFTNNFRIIASYSTAFIAPSTYQLFSQYGNLNLKPEEDASVEAGFIYNLKTVFNLNSVFFYRDVENAIIFGSNNYENAIKTTNVKGVESEIKITATKFMNVILGYTYTYKSADVDYIPKNKFTALLETTTIKNTYLSLQYKYLSERTYNDLWGSGEILNLEPYSIVDLYGSYKILNGKLTVFAEIDNIFNENYVEIIGYTTKGRNYKLGLNFNF